MVYVYLRRYGRSRSRPKRAEVLKHTVIFCLISIVYGFFRKNIKYFLKVF